MKIMLMLSCQVVSDSCNPMTAACQAPLSMVFLRQEYWSRLPFPSPENLPDNPGIDPCLLHRQAGFFTFEPPGKPVFKISTVYLVLIMRQALG